MSKFTENTEGLLALQSVSKTYLTQVGTEHLALQDATISLRRSEFLSLVGPSGCGKTTLLKIAAGLLRESSGQVMFDGQLRKPPPHKMGIVFQTATLLPWLTVVDNVVFPALIQRRDMKAAHTRAHELLAMLDLSDRADRYPSELSGGMQQRVAIARALLLEPEVLFMDEPFGALDAMTREALNIELQNLHQRFGMTVIFVTHSIPEAIFLSDRIAVMSSSPGRIVDVIDIFHSRPRTLEMLTDRAFAPLERRIREIFSTKSKEAR